MTLLTDGAAADGEIGEPGGQERRLATHLEQRTPVISCNSLLAQGLNLALRTMHATLEAVDRNVAAVAVRYPVRAREEAWVLPEGTVPESIPHDTAAERLKLLLAAWASQLPHRVWVARNLAIRWLEDAPRIGIDPDVCVLDPPPEGVEDLSSLCLWKAGHFTPPLCIEVVSKNHPHKDYAAIQDRYAAIKARELVVFDPLLAGPAALGGPVALQLWRLDELGIFERVHFGSEPVFSEVLGAWLIPEGRQLALADDRQGTRRWMTEQERERAEKERERTEKERERAEKERERAEKERERAEKEVERAARLELERRVELLEGRRRP